MRSDTRDIIIIGAGPSGLSAALQLKRAGISALVLERAEPGGLLREAYRIENYPGIPEGISGSELAMRMTDHARNAGVEIRIEPVELLEWDTDFLISTPECKYKAKKIIIATGTSPKKLQNISNSKEVLSKVRYEIFPLTSLVCMHFVIVGAGDAAFDYALNLARNNSVTIINRSNQLRCLPLLYKRASAHSDITYYANTLLTNIEMRNEGRITVECTGDSDRLSLTADYVIPAIGRTPCLDFCSEGFSERSSGLMERQLLWMAGDVKNDMFRQTSIAVADGIRSAMEIVRTEKGTPYESNSTKR